MPHFLAFFSTKSKSFSDGVCPIFKYGFLPKEIKSLIGKLIYDADKKTLRKISFGDIVKNLSVIFIR